MNIFANSLPDILGLIGVAVILITYFLTQTGRIAPAHFAYSFCNLLGSSLILFSLFFDWNLSAAVVEGSWALISLYGLAKYVVKRPQHTA
jgi:hypothetical protein